MSVNNIINLWSSFAIPTKRTYLISNELIKLYSKFTGYNLVNLYNLDDVFNTNGWYIDQNKGNIYQVNLKINSIDIFKKCNIKNILEELKTNTYTSITFFLETLKRNQICDKRNIFESINIYEPGQHPEYFKIIDIKTEELAINSVTEKKISTTGKRGRESSPNPISRVKRMKKDDIDWSEMISASSTRNYFLNDPFIDWVKEYNITSINDIPSKKGNSNGSIKYQIDDPFTKFIMEQGCKFEEQVVQLIEKKHRIVKVAESYQSRDKILYQKTIDLMKKGEPIIYQGILHNYENKTFGAPDLMIRNDYLNKFIGYNVYDETFGSPKLGVEWHYVIVDIKHSQINLTSDSIHIRNDESIPAYKGQLLVYTQALNYIQGSQVSKAFILGKKYQYTVGKITTEIHDFMNKLGTIDYNGFDRDYVDKLIKAVEWLRLVRKEGNNWKLLPLPTKEELFPNMKNDKDGVFNKLKKQLAEEIHEITSVYYCGVKNRKNAFDKGVFSWNDEKCNAETLGFNEGKISKRVNSILNINRQNEVLVSPKKIECNEPNWRVRKSNEMEFYLDYETMNSNFGKIIVDRNEVDYEDFNLIFMIGVGYEDSNGQWQYKSFVVKESNKKSEKEMLTDFWEYIDNTLKLYKKKDAVFVHWSQAEKTSYDKTRLRHPDLPQKNFVDLYQVFIDEPIVIKGALNYSLKSIARALFDHKIINTIWDSSSQCANGLNAMLIAHNIYSKNKQVSVDIPLMKEIEKYNEIDCKCLWEIIRYLRENH